MMFSKMENQYRNESENMLQDKWFSHKSLSGWRIFLAILNYFVGYLFLYPVIVSKITVMIDPSAHYIPGYLQFCVYLFMIITTLILVWPVWKESVTSLKEHGIATVKDVMICLIFLYLVMIVVNAAVMILSQSTNSANQISVENSVKNAPILMMFTTLIFAPIVEEGVFRAAIFRPLRTKHSFLLAALVSAFAFGFIHVSQSLLSGDFQDLWYVFSYAVIGFFSCLSYEKTGNIYASMLFHFLNNLLAMLAIL